MNGGRAWLLVLALIAFPHTEWIQDVADAPGVEGRLIGDPLHVDLETLLVALADAALIAAVIGRRHWLIGAIVVVDLAASALDGDRSAIPGFREDAGYWVVDGLYAAASLAILLLTVRVWLERHGGGGHRPRWLVPFMAGTAVAYVADIVAYGTYCDAHACAAGAPFARAEVPAVDGSFFDLSAEIITGLLIAIVVEGAFRAGRGEVQDRVLRAATVSMLAFAALFCLASTLAAAPEAGAAGHAREDVVQVPLAFEVTVQALVTGFLVLLMAAREAAAEP